MSRVHAIAGTKEFIGSGHVLIPKDVPLAIFPLGTNTDYRLDIEITLTQGAKINSHACAHNRENYTINFVVNWMNDRSLVNMDILCGCSKSYDYFLSSVITFVGTAESYVVDFRYTVSRQSKT